LGGTSYKSGQGVCQGREKKKIEDKNEVLTKASLGGLGSWEGKGRGNTPGSGPGRLAHQGGRPAGWRKGSVKGTADGFMVGLPEEKGKKIKRERRYSSYSKLHCE